MFIPRLPCVLLFASPDAEIMNSEATESNSFRWRVSLAQDAGGEAAADHRSTASCPEMRSSRKSLTWTANRQSPAPGF
jgi:hypothetical protein